MSEARAGSRILVVDDDATIRAAVRRILSRLGHEVHEAPDGVEGLELARKLHPAVVILDLRMPGMDGHTFLRRFAQEQEHFAVIISSGSGDTDDAIDALRMGAVDYLRKPWTPSDLIAAVLRALERLGAERLDK